MTSARKTPLFREHQELGARMIDFHGWLMPIQYTSILEEARVVRENVGVFDISHMGEAEVKGKHAHELLQFLTCNDISRIEDGQAQYTALINEEGGIIDDLLVYKVTGDRYFLCLNAANTETDVSWLADQALQYPDVEVRNLTSHYGLLSVQGPNSEPLLKQLTRRSLDQVDYYSFVVTSLGEKSVLLSRTGYTGEDGFEIFCDTRDAHYVWKEIMSRGRAYGIKPIGLGARDTLRLEMGYALHGQDIDASTTPYEAGLGWIVKLEKDGGFIGCDVLSKQKRDGVGRKLCAFEMVDRGVPRTGYAIFAGGEKVGEVTSGSMSPTLGKAIGMGYVKPELALPGARLYIEIRGKMIEARVAKRPMAPSRVKKKVARA